MWSESTLAFALTFNCSGEHMLNILHLSDLHIKENTPVPDSLIESIRNAIKCEIENGDTTCVLCSGDISYSGSSPEYTVAEDFFKKLLKDELKTAFLILSPGNHDNNFSQDTSIRNSVIKDITAQCIATEAQILECLKVQKNYENFKFKVETSKPTTELLLNNTYQIGCKDKLITISSVNSAFSCDKECLEGKVFIPIEYLNIDTVYSDYRIGLLHHTPNWFLSQKQRELRSSLLKNYDIIFFGHEHDPSNYTMCVSPWQSTNLIEGGIINPATNKESSFNFVKIDFENDSLKITEFKYDIASNIFRSTKESSATLSDSKYSRQYSELSVDFIKFLDDPGATFNHPRKTTLVLSDIYVFPNLKNITKTDTSAPNDISSKRILQDDLGKLVIEGDDKSGKTAYAKVLFSELVSKNMVPAYIDCKDITKGKVKKIDELILDRYQKQYANIDIDKFKQNRKEKTVPIIDNFHQAKLNNIEKLEFIHALSSHYDNFLILTGESFLLEELARIENNQPKFAIKIIPSLKSYKLKALGHSLRGELLKKWFDISDEYIDHEELGAQTYDECMSTLNKIVSYNYVPPYPLYLLTALSATSSKLVGDLSAGSYGHYYQALVTLALARVDDRHAEVDLKISFLSELSFFLFKNNVSSLSDSELNNLVNDYNIKFATSIQNDFISNLLKADIFYKYDSNIYFRYRYIYYYFVALYISKNLHEDNDSEAAIDRLINSLYKESSSSILLVLINFSKDKIILNKLNNYAKSIFKYSPKASIDDDTEHFNELVSHAYELVIPDSSPSTSRKEREKISDIASQDDEREYRGTNLEINDDDESVDRFTHQISATIRCVDIIGQALKSHYGSLRGDQKDPLFAEGINLPLRALGDFYSFMRKNTSIWLQDIQDEISKRGVLTESQIEQISKKFLTQLSAALSFFFISLPTRAFASENLKKTFTTYFSGVDKSNANELLDFYLELESTKKINFSKLEQLITNLKSNIIGFSVLQQIMGNFLYMNRTDYKTKDKISSLLNISTKQQVMIDIKAEDKKIR